MRYFLRKLLVLAAVTVQVTFSLVPHALAVPVPMHDTEMKHNQSPHMSSRCVSLCTSAVLDQNVVELDYTKHDIEPNLPYYALIQTPFIYDNFTTIYSHGLATKPLPKVPIYLLHNLIRI